MDRAELRRRLAMRQARLHLLEAAERSGEALAPDHDVRKFALAAEVAELEAALGVQLTIPVGAGS